jgi:exopolyphosphatase/guanosine-5'-triphosphate,3'-diphosphate pyrophosphatase
MKIRKLAGIDIGSNAMRLLVMNVITDDRGRKPIYRKSSLVRVPVRLGADTFLTGEISESSVDRMIKDMRSFSLLMEVHGVED